MRTPCRMGLPMRFTSLRRTIRNFNGLHIIDMHLASMYLIGVHLVAGMLQACMLQVSISQAEISYRRVSLAGVYLRGRRTFIPIEQATRPAGVLCGIRWRWAFTKQECRTGTSDAEKRSSRYPIYPLLIRFSVYLNGYGVA